jgi:hypothetical protein
LGAIGIGDVSVGALAIGKYAAIGDNARAMILNVIKKNIMSMYTTGEIAKKCNVSVK